MAFTDYNNVLPNFVVITTGWEGDDYVFYMRENHYGMRITHTLTLDKIIRGDCPVGSRRAAAEFASYMELWDSEPSILNWDWIQEEVALEELDFRRWL